MDNTSIAAAFLEGLEQFDQLQLCTLDKTQADAVSNLKSVLKCLALTIYILLGMGTIFTCYHPGKIGPFLSQAVEAFTSALKIRFLCLFIKTDDIRAMMNFVDFLEYDEEGGVPWQMKWQFWFATDRGVARAIRRAIEACRRAAECPCARADALSTIWSASLNEPIAAQVQVRPPRDINIHAHKPEVPHVSQIEAPGIKYVTSTPPT
ncbi:hypothetical protein PMZ80_005628 [Knufia obscura]|uniref:Uncharacterized protein n=1 Tax=Knufia obscura TaxID=1635080 RepID=A0ABR0RN66_9EURO|nr:hypothetical protein PMZ80_005628 [Knufia obscura]